MTAILLSEQLLARHSCSPVIPAHPSFLLTRHSCSPVIPAQAGIHLGACIDRNPDGFLLAQE
jgi:hypothetical protein